MEQKYFKHIVRIVDGEELHELESLLFPWSRYQVVTLDDSNRKQRMEWIERDCKHAFHILPGRDDFAIIMLPGGKPADINETNLREALDELNNALVRAAEMWGQGLLDHVDETLVEGKDFFADGTP